LARLIEVAAYQTKLKMSGYNAAQELNDRLIAQMTSGQSCRRRKIDGTSPCIV
jgi:serine kinase of HPr protein (carbohydrate metabolism regulator)